MITENCNEYRNTLAHHEDSHAEWFLALEKKMAEMSHDVSAQHAKTERLEGAVHRLANQNWSQGQELACKDVRIKELEEEMLAVKAGLKDQRVNHCSLDIVVIEVQERVKDLESHVEWINKLHNCHSETLDDFSICIDNTEETLEEFEGNWWKYDGDQRWNVMMMHLGSQRRYVTDRKLEIVATQISDVKETLMREIHCSHCPHGDGESIGDIHRGPSGWAPCYQSKYRLSEVNGENAIREDEAEVSQRMWGFDEETEEVPIVVGSPSSIISQEVGLRLVSPLDLDSGESETPGSPVSTIATLVPDKNVVPLPVVRGVVRTPFNGRHHPYPTPPPASSEWDTAHHAPTGLIHYYVERPAVSPGWGTVTEQVVPAQPILG